MTALKTQHLETAVAGARSMADYIDRLITVEIRNQAMPHGKIAPLYDAARAEGGGEPLTLRAAAGLLENVGKGDVVLINTGAGSGELIPNGEDDGPVGAAVLARVLYRGLGATPVYVCEEHHAAPIVASSEAAGVPVRELDVVLRTRVGAAVVTTPPGQDSVPAWSEGLLDQLNPRAIIAVERLGPNSMGVIHGATGIRSWQPLVDSSPVFEAAAHTCQCPCGGGMATVVPADVLVVAAVSNWGAYGIEATLSLLLGRPNLPHTPETTRRILERCLEAGGIEAMFCTQQFYCDGISGENHMSIVRLLGEMVRVHLEDPTTGPIH
jgi:hypothetical protein